MVSLWCIFGLVIAAISVSFLGAAFSVVGLAALFSGAATAVCAMAGSLEFAKFVLAAYLHQRWNNIHWFFKSYLVTAIVVLSLITSMGIFGFLSNAYESSSATLEAENIKLDALKIQKAQVVQTIDRLNHSIEEIPAERITKRLKARADAAPEIAKLNSQITEIDEQIKDSNLTVLEIKEKVGPLIYIARAFHMDIDTVVKYLILVFIGVFDPLALCLVVACSEAIQTRRLVKLQMQPQSPVQPQPQYHQMQPQPQMPTQSAPVAQPAAAVADPPVAASNVNSVEHDDGAEVIQMRFIDPEPKSSTEKKDQNTA